MGLMGVMRQFIYKRQGRFFIEKERDYFRDWYKNCVFIEEFMRVRFHPDNLNHFEDWGHSEHSEH